MKDNYYSLKSKNQSKLNNKHKRKRKKLKKGSHYYQKQQKNYRKRQAKKLNYKKVFIALIILILIIYLLCSGISKLFLNNSKTEIASVDVTPKDITINMAAIRRHYVSFN